MNSPTGRKPSQPQIQQLPIGTEEAKRVCEAFAGERRIELDLGPPIQQSLAELEHELKALYQTASKLVMPSLPLNASINEVLSKIERLKRSTQKRQSPRERASKVATRDA